MQIVLIDSSRVVLRSVSDMLHAAGHTVTSFSNTDQALDYIKTNTHVTCVLTSIETYPLNGLELCWAIRAVAHERRPLAILVMSSSKDSHHLGEVLDSGADDFINKPPKGDELHARLRSAERMVGLQQELIRQADTDHMTRLLNRGAFLRHASLLMKQARDARSTLKLMLIDIDHFKDVNDRYGHDAGDRVIRGVADVLRETGAEAGRFGGEEFILLMEDHEIGSAGVIAHQIRTRCAALKVTAKGKRIAFTVSIGVSDLRAADDINDAIKRADIALYAAKRGGRNRVSFADINHHTEQVS